MQWVVRPVNLFLEIQPEKHINKTFTTSALARYWTLYRRQGDRRVSAPPKLAESYFIISRLADSKPTEQSSFLERHQYQGTSKNPIRACLKSLRKNHRRKHVFPRQKLISCLFQLSAQFRRLDEARLGSF